MSASAFRFTSISWATPLIFALAVSACANPSTQDAPPTSDLQVADPEDPYGTVRPPESALKAFEVAIVGEADDTDRTMVPAKVQFRDAATSAVVSPIEGRVEAIYVTHGQVVQQGDPVADIRSSELLDLQSSLREAQARQKLAKDTLARQERLAQDGVGIPAELIQAQTEVHNASNEVSRIRSVLKNIGSSRAKTLTLYAPRDGVVLDRNVVIGDAVGPDTGALMRIGDTQALWLVAHIFDGDLGRVVHDSRVRIHLPGGLDSTYGNILRVGEVVDTSMRRAPVWIELDDTEGLRPGMMGQAAIKLRGDSAMRLPPTAVLLTESGDYRVWVEVEEGAYQPRKVIVGQTRHGLVEVMSGLEPGERVVVKGALLLDASASMRL